MSTLATPSSFTTVGSGVFTAPYDGYFWFVAVGAGGPAGAGRLAHQGGAGGSGGRSYSSIYLRKGETATYTNIAGAAGGTSGLNAGTPAADSADGCQWVLDRTSAVICSAKSGKKGIGGAGVDGTAGVGALTTGCVGDVLIAGNAGTTSSGVSTGGTAPNGGLNTPNGGAGGLRGNPGANGSVPGGGGGGGTTSGNTGGDGGNSGCYVGSYLHEVWS